MKRLGGNMRSVLLFAASAALISAWPASAQQVSPMIYDLAPAGSEASNVIRILNNQSRPLTIEMLVFAREIAEDGTETRTAADDDFIIFPPQMIIQPGQTQAVRVQYVGGPIDATKLYIVQVTQVPVEDPNQASGVQFVINFGTSAAVSPAGSRHEITVAGVTPVEGGLLRVEIENAGTRYASLAGSEWEFRGANGSPLMLEGDALDTALKTTLVPARGRRVFTVPAPEGLDVSGPIALNISLRAEQSGT